MTPAGLAVAGFACFFLALAATLIAVERTIPDDRPAWWAAGILWASSVALLLASFAWEVLK